MQIKIDGAIYMDHYRPDDTPRFTFLRGKPESFDGYALVMPYTLIAETPEVDHRAVQVAALRQELTKVRAESQARITQIEGHISKLLALDAPSDL
jgi:hypothetical protein